MDEFNLSSIDVNSKRSNRNIREVELRRSIEEHMERKRLMAEFGDVIDL